MTASPSSLSITACGVNHTVTLTAGPDAVGGTLSVQIVSAPQGGGSYFNQVDTEITVAAPPNAAPVANNDSYGTNEDTPLTVAAPGVLGNDTDADGNALSAVLVAGPSNASSFTLNANGSFSYSPNANFNGSDSFTYRANDGTANSNVATVTINVAAVNDQPTLDAIDDVTVAEDSGAHSVNLAGISAGPANESGQSLAVTATSDNPSLIPNPSVSYTSPNATGSLSFTPAADQTGTANITVTVTDGPGATRSRTFQITVTPVNDAPIANNDSETTNEDESVVVDVLANDSDIDGGPLSVVASSLSATNGTASVISGGADDGKVLFTPNANFHGSASFTYQANDGSDDSNTATVSITVVSVNDAPVADNDSASTTEDNAVVVNVLDGDSDVDGDALSVVSGSLNGTNGTATLITSGPDAGKVLFTPDADFYGPASFTYRVSDGSDNSNVATVSITVTPVNDAPVADNDSATTDEDTSVDIDVLDGDADVDGDDLSISTVNLAAHGSTAIVGGKIRYTPDANFFGTDSFTYEVCDDGASTPASGDELCDTATVNVTVSPVNDAPVADDDSATVAEDDSVLVDVLDGDTDVDGDGLTVTSASGASHGTVAVESGKVRYTPDANFFGTDSFTYEVCDNGASTPASGDELCDSATVNVNVTAVNDAPEVTAGANQTTDEGSSVTVDGSFTDVDQATGEQYEVVINWGDSSQTTQYVTSNSFSASHIYADDESGAADDDFPVTITVTDSGTTNGSSDPKSGSGSLTVHVNNVAPTVAPPTLNLDPVTGVLSMSTTFSDPADGLDAPYTGKFIVNGNEVAGSVSGNSLTGTTKLAPGCHTISVAASVTDNDSGTGTSAGTPLLGGDVYTASFMAPIRDDVRNIAKYGNVVPVKVQLASSCVPGTTATTASLYLTIAQGQDAMLDDSVDDSSTVVVTSVSNADSGTQMRVSDGKYIYNLSTKTMTQGKDYTIRVRSGSATGPIILRALFQPKK